jgi:ribosomal-protein-alanine N-acetyltransferase
MESVPYVSSQDGPGRVQLEGFGPTRNRKVVGSNPTSGSICAGERLSSKTSIFGWIRRWQPEDLNCGRSTSKLAPLGGVERPRRKERFTPLMHRRVRAFWRTYGPAPPSVASQPELVATQSDAAGRLVGSSAEGWAHVRGTPPATPDQGSRPRPSAPVRHRPLDQRSLPVVPLPQPHARRRRWEKDGCSAMTPASSPSPYSTTRWPGSWPGAASRPAGLTAAASKSAPCCFPSTAGEALGPRRKDLEYLFATTLANRLQAITVVENLAEQRALERIGFRREGVRRGLAFDSGRWHDGVLYARLRATLPDYPRPAAGRCDRSSGE